VGHLVTLLSAELGRDRGVSPDEAYELLTRMPPSGIQERLESVLQRYGSLETLPQELDRLSAKGARGMLRWNPDLGYDGLSVPAGGWLEWRQHQGVVDRRPADFYRRVWHVFRRTPALIIGDRLDRRNRMDSSVVQSDMTPDEQSFALWLEHLLNKIASPEYRQLVSESLSVLASFLEQHETLQIQDPIALDAVVGHAVHLAFIDGDSERATSYNQRKAEAWDAFYRRSPAEASDHFVAALRHLLERRAAG
jgi:phosphorylase kinase alpha/beta subunit